MSAGGKEDCFCVDDVNDDFKRAKALEEVFDAVARYGEKREKHERTTREAMMSIAAARYALGRVGWEKRRRHDENDDGNRNERRRRRKGGEKKGDVCGRFEGR